MTEEEKAKHECCDYKDQKMSWSHRKHWHNGHGGSGAFYFFGFIGTAVYFIGQATTFGMGVLKPLAPTPKA